MKISEEIKWLQKCRQSAQEVVDKINERIAELQEQLENKSIGYDVKKTETKND